MKLFRLNAVAFFLFAVAFSSCNESSDRSGVAPAPRAAEAVIGYDDDEIDSESSRDERDSELKRGISARKKNSGGSAGGSAEVVCGVEQDDDVWEGLSYALTNDSEEKMMCQYLVDSDKDAAIVYMVEDSCETCVEEVKNVNFAILRSAYKDYIQFIVVLPEESIVEEYADISSDILVVHDQSGEYFDALPEDVLEGLEGDRLPVLFSFDVNLDSEFLIDDLYLEIIPQAESFLGDVDVDDESVSAKTSWAADQFKGTGTIDVIPTQ